MMQQQKPGRAQTLLKRIALVQVHQYGSIMATEMRALRRKNRQNITTVFVSPPERAGTDCSAHRQRCWAIRLWCFE
jgi:hypothetical protein